MEDNLKNTSVDMEIKDENTQAPAPNENAPQGRVLKRFLAIGQHKDSSRGRYDACYCEGTSFREIMVAFARQVDWSTGKTRAKLYKNIVYSLWEGTATGYCLDLFTEMFDREVVFIGEVSKVFCGENFINKLMKEQAEDYTELPF